MNKEQRSIEEYAKKYGFSLVSYSPDFEVLTFRDKTGLIITASDISNGTSMKIYYILDNFFILTTGIFLHPHPKFEKQYLNPMKKKVALLERKDDV